MFFTNLDKFDYLSLQRNVYDLSQNYMFVSLLPKYLKKVFLSYINQDAFDAYQYILNIDDEFVIDPNKAEYTILGAFSYYFKIEDQLNDYIEEMRKNKNKLLFFYSSDDDRTINFNKKFKLNSNQFIFFRTGGFKTKNSSNVLGIPYIVKDYFSGNYKDKHLSISYCGWPKNNEFKESVVEYLLDFKYSDFIIRDYWANDERDLLGQNSHNSYILGPSEKSKKEFIDNMERNLYGLAIRGAVNNSYRLYELFMMGRIPILLNTDCILPFENEIPYKKNTIFIEDFTDIDGQIRKFHNEHTEEELLNIQKENRQIWLKYFRVDGAYNETKKILSNY